MTDAQKLLAGLGVMAVLATTPFVPYDYEADIPRTVLDDGANVTGTMRAPLWAPPHEGNVASDVIRKRNLSAQTQVSVRQVRLGAGRAGLWWALIALCTVVGIVLASPRRDTRPSSPTS